VQGDPTGTRQRHRSSSRALLVLTLVSVGLFAATVGPYHRAAAIVEHTVALAHALGLRLVAEGVEDAATGAALAALGCDVAQGYAIARPMPADEFLRWLDAPRRSLLDRTY
jgi:diguanylate cyclase